MNGKGAEISYPHPIRVTGRAGAPTSTSRSASPRRRHGEASRARVRSAPSDRVRVAGAGPRDARRPAGVVGRHAGHGEGPPRCGRWGSPGERPLRPGPVRHRPARPGRVGDADVRQHGGRLDPADGQDVQRAAAATRRRPGRPGGAAPLRAQRHRRFRRWTGRARLPGRGRGRRHRVRRDGHAGAARGDAAAHQGDPGTTAGVVPGDQGHRRPDTRSGCGRSWCAPTSVSGGSSTTATARN